MSLLDVREELGIQSKSTEHLTSWPVRKPSIIKINPSFNSYFPYTSVMPRSSGLRVLMLNSSLVPSCVFPLSVKMGVEIFSPISLNTHLSMLISCLTHTPCFILLSLVSRKMNICDGFIMLSLSFSTSMFF